MIPKEEIIISSSCNGFMAYVKNVLTLVDVTRFC